MAGVTDPSTQRPAPGERRLPRPPSDRYADGRTGDGDPAPGSNDGPGSTARALGFGTIAAVGGALAIVVFGGVLAISAGLLVVAVAAGYAVGVAVPAGAGSPGRPNTTSRATRRGIAVGLAGMAIVLGQVGLWLFARSEGGVLSLPDYLAQTFGALVPLEIALAVGAAWWTTR
jgi:hypothetical protein